MIIKNEAKAVTLSDVRFSYARRNALADISFEVYRGSYYGIVGPNGSGKTTLAYIIARILAPQKGHVDTQGLKVGLVLSNPENQVVSLLVEEDIAFGPENLGLASDQIRQRIEDALKITRSENLRHSLTSALSGGQLSQIVFSGQLAMDVDILVLDEGTVMLDPANRASLLDTIRSLNNNYGKTIIHISHRLDDLETADTIMCMKEGRVIHTAVDVLDLTDDLITGNVVIPGVEPGAKILYKNFLRQMQLDSDNLERSSRELAGRMVGSNINRTGERR
ncbi:MAG: ATP-binding cassette domain-containing protein [Deltaproteobacteria bacterium]|nr:ATP-binding cassette domain-containing protein [Deltaproteobacteria bacterium]